MEIEKGGRELDRQEKKTVDQVEKTHKFWLGGYALIALSCLCVYVLIKFDVINAAPRKLYFIRLSASCFIVGLLLFMGKFFEMLIVRGNKSRAYKYNFIRLVRLLMVLLIIVVAVSFLWQNWYAAAVSLGLLSLILGFALQVPISSFIGWLYIIFRSPYRVGDRIEISQFTGDVIEVGYLDTTLTEFGGSFLSNDLPSGRLIRFPNSLVLQSAVFNYSWQQFPFIWNEIAFQIAYNSDLEFVKDTIRKTTKLLLDPDMPENVADLKELIRNTPVENLNLKEYPMVNIRISSNTWVEAVVTYLVHPKKAAAMRTRIIENSLDALNQHPERALFPKGENR